MARISDKFKYLYAIEGLRMRRLVICVILLLIMVQLSVAIGVGRPSFPNDRMVIDNDVNESVFFQLQNGESVSKTVLFKVVIQSPAMIKDGLDVDYAGNATVFQKQYVLPAKSVQMVKIDINAPDGLYRVDYSYSEADAGNGSVRFDTLISDSFFVKSGTGSPNYILGIPLDYGTYSLDTSSNSIKFIDDLLVIGSNIQIDYRGQTLDLTGFQGSYIIFGSNKVTVDSTSFPALNAPAKLTFANINSPYKILKNGVDCSTSVCSVISYSSKRLTFSVTGFSTYEVVAVANTTNTTTPVSSSSSSSSGGSSGGIIPNRTVTNNSGGVPVVKPSGNNQPSQQTSSSGSASTPQVTSEADRLGLGTPVAPVNKQPTVTNLNPTSDKKKVIVAVFAAIGFLNLIMAIVLFRRR